MLNLPPHSNCELCPLHTTALSVGIATTRLPESLVSGPGVPAIIVVGSHPGTHENTANEPFVGPTGDFLKSVYLPDFINRASIYLTNAVRCYPEAKLTIGPYNKCIIHTISDILVVCRQHHPYIPRVLCVAAPAFRSLYLKTMGKVVTHKQSFGLQGTKIPIIPGTNSKNGPYHFHIFSTFHPAQLHPEFGSGDTRDIHVVQDHLQILSRHLENDEVAPLSEPSIVPIRNP